MNPNKTDREKLKWFFKRYIYIRKKYLFLIIGLILVGSLVANVTPYLYGKMLDSITLGDMDLLTNLIIIYFFITLFTNLLGMLEDYVGQITNFKLSKNVQVELFNKMIRMRTSSYSKYKIGELISRLNGDADNIVSFGINIITSILHVAVNIIVSLYFVINISIRLSSVAIFYLPMSFLITYIARRYFKELAHKKKKFGDQYYSFQNETFLNNTGIKSFQLENKINDKYMSFIDKEFKLLKRSIKLGNMMQLGESLITVISSLYIIYLSAILINDGILTIGLMVSFNTYINKLFSSISQLFNVNISLQGVMVSLNRIIEVMGEDIEVSNELTFEKQTNPILECVDIAFSYGNEKENVLTEMTISIDKFGLYSIVGSNGCGKSTFAKLLIKLYDVEAGHIYMNGVDYCELTFDNIRRHITYVQKEEFFFNDTIINNIRLADESLKEEDLKNMCKKVGLDEFISSLPEGYKTMVGEGGSTLSSGQKQKLSIARALLRNTPIYIFDEITANLDGKADKDVMRIIKEYSKKSIILFISHKTSSIIDSDKIFVLADGRVVGIGDHDYLLKNNYKYKELFENKKIDIELEGVEEIGG